MADSVIPAEPKPEKPPIIASKLRLFIILSLGLHFGIAIVYGIPEYMRRAEEKRRQEEVIKLAKLRKDAEKKRKEEVQKQAREETKKEVVEDLKKDFEQLAQNDLKKEEAQELWEDIVEDLGDELNEYADELADTTATDDDLRKQLNDIKRKMVNQFLKKLRAVSAKSLAEKFLKRVKDEVVPKVADTYKKEIERRVGEPLKNEGAKIVREEQSLVERERKAINDALDNAAREADKAQKDLAGAKERTEKANPGAKAANDKVAEATKAEEKNIDAAAAQVKAAKDAVERASGKAQDGAPKEAADAGKQQGETAQKEAGEAKAAANKGDATEAKKEAGEASDAAKKLGDAAAKAKDEIAKSGADAKDKTAAGNDLDNARKQADAAANALAGVMDRIAKAEAAAEQANKTANDAAAGAAKREQATAERAENALKNAEAALRKAGEKAEAFGEDLKKKIEGTADDKARDAQQQASDVRHAAKDGKAAETAKEAAEGAEAAAKLGDAVKDAKDAAAKAQFDPAALARAVLKDVKDTEMKGIMEDEFKKGVEANVVPRLGDKLTDTFQKQLDKNGMKDDQLVKQVGEKIREMLGNDVADKTKAGEAATKALDHNQNLDKADKGAKKNASREKAVKDKAAAAAKDLAEREMKGLTGDGKHDESFAQMAAGPHGEGGEGESLLERVERMAQNANEGRMGFMEGGLEGDGEQGQPGAGGSGSLASRRRAALERSMRAKRVLASAYTFNSEKHKELTAGMNERDKAAAAGDVWERKGAEGETAAGTNSEVIVRPSTMIVPPEPKGEVKGEAEKKDPWKPQFKTIRHAAVPFIREPVKLDGDLAEWKDVPSLALLKCRDGGKIDGLKIVEPQLVKVAWDNQGFYFAYDMKDADNDVRKVQPGNFWEGDGAEIWFDALNTKDAKRGMQWAQQFWVWPFGQGGDDTVIGGEAVKDDPKKDWHWVAYKSDKLQRAAKKTGDGWVMEVFLPAERLHKLTLAPGKIIGFNLSITTGTNLYFYWAGSSEVRTSERPDTWGDVLLSGSDGVLEVPNKLTAELKGDEKATPLRAAIIGEALKLRVVDMDMNLSDRRRDKVSVTVKSRNGDTQVAVLEETGEKTGTFEGAISTRLSLGETAPNVLSMYEGESVDVIYVDQARADGSRNVEVKLAVKSAAGTTDLAGQ